MPEATYPAGVANVTVRLSRPVSQEVKVHYATIPGTAKANWDYGTTAGMLHFEAGSITATVTIKIIKDKLKEGDEQFRLFFWKPKELSLKKSAAVITIRDGDRPFGGSAVAAKESSTDRLPEESGLRLLAYPNPAQAHFTLLPASAEKSAMSARVWDVSGKLVALLHGLLPGRPFVLGAGYAPGLYLVQLQQGHQTTQVKLIKQR